MKKWLVVLLLLIAPPAFAGEALLSWTAPTQNEDGTSYIDPEGYNIYYGLTSGGPYPTGINIPDYTVISYTVLDLSPMTYYFVATAYNTSQEESQYSNEATKTILGIPDPPIGLVVGPSDLFVYYISQSKDVVVLVPTGTILEGTSCDGTMTVNGHYRVPVDDVVWVGSLRPPVVFALCQ
jgi:hypothetical protein